MGFFCTTCSGVEIDQKDIKGENPIESNRNQIEEDQSEMNYELETPP